MIPTGSAPIRSSAPWSCGLLVAGVVTLCALGGVHPLARPHFAVAAVLLRNAAGTQPPQTAPRGGARGPAPRPHVVSAAVVSAPMIQMLALINAERAQAGASPLRFDPTLSAIAQDRSQDMITRHYFAHEIPGVPGVHMVFDILDHDNVQYKMAGENLALNNYIDFYPLSQTIQQTNSDLMRSPEHRANLLEPAYTRIGLGLAFEPRTGTLILTEVFVQP